MGEYLEIPENWSYALLGEVCHILTGDKDVNEGDEQGQYPFFTCAKDISKFSSFSFDGDALLIAGNGNFSVKKYSGKFEAYQRTYVLQEFKIDHLYLYYYIKYKLRDITKDNRGSTIRYIRIGNLTDYPIQFPSMLEQQHIVDKIEELFSELDKGIESLKTAREQLKVYRQSLLKHAFEGKLTEQWRAAQGSASVAGAGSARATKLESADDLLARISKERETRYQQQLDDWKVAVKQWEEKGKEGKRPSKPTKPKILTKLEDNVLANFPKVPQEWVWDKLGWMTLGVEYGTSAKSAKDGTHPVLRMGNIQNGKFDWDDLVYTSDLSEIGKYLLSKGDVLFNRTNSPELVGKTAIIKEDRPAIFAGYLIRINHFNNQVDSQYLNLFLNSYIAKQYGNTVKTDGVNQSNINGNKLSNYPFPFCSLDEQQKIVQILEDQLSIIDQMNIEVDQNLLRSEALRQSILKKAFSGQLVSQDPNDEPASVLLERIKAEKAEQDKLAKARKTTKRASKA